MKTLNDLFLSGLAEMYDAEHRIIKALPKLAKSAASAELKDAFQTHLKETKGHVRKVEQIFQAFGQPPRHGVGDSMAGLLAAGDKLIEVFLESPAGDAALIAAAQTVEHHEIASYGCLHEWAELLGNRKAALLLEEILDEEKVANETLTDLARSTINEEAMALWGNGASGNSPSVEANELQAPVANRAKRGASL